MAWKELEPQINEVIVNKSIPSASKKSAGRASSSSNAADNISKGTVPLILKTQPIPDRVLLCELDDGKEQFRGDTGAIGRLYCNDEQDHLRLDLKGKQYKGS